MYRPAYVSEQQWLLMNQVSGVTMIASGLLMLAVGIILLHRRRQGRLTWDDKRLALIFGLLPLPLTLLAVTLPYAFIG